MSHQMTKIWAGAGSYVKTAMQSFKEHKVSSKHTHKNIIILYNWIQSTQCSIANKEFKIALLKKLNEHEVNTVQWNKDNWTKWET